MNHLSHQVVLITGCSSGIGRALVHAFAARGHRTFASARRLEAISDLEGNGIDRLQLDVTDPNSVHNALAQVIRKAGRVDIVVNNAGFICVGPLAEVPLEDVRAQFETNVVGALRVVQAVFSTLANQGSGRVVNIGSVVGVLPTPFAGAYCASKSALHTLNEVLRMELLPFGIDVVLIEPGRVRSRIADTASLGLERYSADSSRYRLFYRSILARAAASQENPKDADLVARQIVEVVTRSRPPKVLRVGRGAKLIPTLSLLPRWLLDRLLMRRFGLSQFP